MIFDECDIKSLIRPVPDFPKPGVVFRDITPLFQSPRALRMVADSVIQRYVEAEFSHIGAMDARGFLIGSIIAYELNKPLILFRKQGKLPADVLSAAYQTEYGEAHLEVHADSLCDGDKVLIFDDLIATGGTLLAAARLVRRLGAQVFEAAAILTNEKFRGVRMVLEDGVLRIVSTNAEQEEAMDELEIDYQGDKLDIGFNVTYLLDVFNNLSSETVDWRFNDGNSSALITLPGNEKFKYVVMPMRI